MSQKEWKLLLKVLCFDMKEIKSIQDFFEQVEQHDHTWLFDSNISASLSKLLDLKIISRKGVNFGGLWEIKQN